MRVTLRQPQELARTARSLLDWHVSMHCNVLPMCAMRESKIAKLWPTEDATSNRRQPLWPKRKHPCVRPVGGGSHSSHLIVLLQAGTGVTRRRRTFTSTTWKEWKVERDWRSGNAVKLSFPSLPCDLRHTHLILGVRYRAKARRRRSY